MESDQNAQRPVAAQISARRREIFERTQAKYASVGIQFDDREYLALIEKWINGELTMPEAATRWDEARKSRKRKTLAVVPGADAIDVDLESLPKFTQEQILAEIAKLTDWSVENEAS